MEFCSDSGNGSPVCDVSSCRRPRRASLTTVESSVGPLKLLVLAIFVIRVTQSRPHVTPYCRVSYITALACMPASQSPDPYHASRDLCSSPLQAARLCRSHRLVFSLLARCRHSPVASGHTHHSHNNRSNDSFLHGSIALSLYLYPEM